MTRETRVGAVLAIMGVAAIFGVFSTLNGGHGLLAFYLYAGGFVCLSLGLYSLASELTKS